MLCGVLFRASDDTFVFFLLHSSHATITRDRLRLTTTSAADRETGAVGVSVLEGAEVRLALVDELASAGIKGRSFLSIEGVKEGQICTKTQP